MEGELGRRESEDLLPWSLVAQNLVEIRSRKYQILQSKARPETLISKIRNESKVGCLVDFSEARKQPVI